MIVGIISGTYSTVFIASSIAIILSHRRGGTAGRCDGRRLGGECAGREQVQAEESARRVLTRDPSRRCTARSPAGADGVSADLLDGASADRRRLVGFDDPGEAFTVMIQLGSILAMMWLYPRQDHRRVIRGLPSDPAARRFALMILVAFLPALFAGALLERLRRAGAGRESPRHRRRLHRRRRGDAARRAGRARRCSSSRLTRRRSARAFGIGVFQTLALMPGVSRSGATIVGARLLGLDRAAAAEFSFFLAMPTMIAAFVHDLLDVRHYLTRRTRRWRSASASSWRSWRRWSSCGRF